MGSLGAAELSLGVESFRLLDFSHVLLACSQAKDREAGGWLSGGQNGTYRQYTVSAIAVFETVVVVLLPFRLLPRILAMNICQDALIV